MQFGSSLDSFPCFTRLNPCVAHCSTDSIPWVHHSREEGSLDYDGGFVRLQIHMNFDTIIYCQQGARGVAHLADGGGVRGSGHPPPALLHARDKSESLIMHHVRFFWYGSLSMSSFCFAVILER
jgi:hypothetical protein